MKGTQLLAFAGVLLAGCASSPQKLVEIPMLEPRMHCGQADIALDLNENGNRLTLTHLEDERELVWVASDSGTRYESTDSENTWFRARGDTATLVLDGVEFPTCLASGAVEIPFTATGNEPFWRVIVEPGQLVLERPGHTAEELRYKTLSRTDSGRRFRAAREELTIDLVTAPQLCRDSMTGMPHPVQVRLVVNGNVESGCGGDPDRLLMGTEWVVESMGGQGMVEGMVDKFRATVQFLPDGRIAGIGSCNRYTGRWSLSGEALNIENLAMTRKACQPELMEQEARLLRQLESTRGFDISPQGELLLRTDSGLSLRASQAGR